MSRRALLLESDPSFSCEESSPCPTVLMVEIAILDSQFISLSSIHKYYALLFRTSSRMYRKGGIR